MVKIAHIKEFIMGISLFALPRLAPLVSGREQLKNIQGELINETSSGSFS